MPPRNDETNVFKIPHGRMLQLVNTCNEKLTITDFANNDELFMLLNNMQSVFIEFKSHEDIENEYIMKQLKSKLKALAIHNSAVCNCHKVDEFTPLFQLVDMGFLHVNKTKTTSERISFGVKFRKALNQFTQRFVPHMKEEEEEFQPLLMKYFSENELVEMKNIVIKSHIQQRKSSFSATDKKETLIKQQINYPTNHFNELPNEIIMKIFSFMDLKEKLNAARVSRYWNQMIYDKFNWRKLNYSDWKNNLDFNSQTCNNDPEDNIYSDDEENEVKTNEQKIDLRILRFWIKYLLPKVGPFIQELNLNHCRYLTNNIARRILKKCPNLKVLNLSFTKISGNAFRGVDLKCLEYMNCEGCAELSDDAFKYLVLSPEPSDLYYNNLIKSLDSIQIDHINKTLDENFEQNHEKYTKEVSNSLRYINLSGCWLITDFGLGCIATKYDLTNLNYLNLSGCINLSSMGMSLLVEMSNSLTGDNLYYCDNITDGPMKEIANSCDNYCGKKFCCRKNH